MATATTIKKTTTTDKEYEKYVKKAVKLIKSGDFNNKKDIEGISNMFAMDMARDLHGPTGKAYQMGVKKYKPTLFKKVTAKL